MLLSEAPACVDTLIFSPTENRLMKKLTGHVLDVLLPKSKLFQRDVVYWGSVIRSEKDKTITTEKHPKCNAIRILRSFMGSAR